MMAKFTLEQKYIGIALNQFHNYHQGVNISKGYKYFINEIDVGTDCKVDSRD